MDDRAEAPSPAASPVSPPRRPWLRRLQHVRLRTKIVVPMVVLAVGPLLAIGVAAIAHLRLVLREAALERLDFDASVKARAIEEFLEGVQEDLRFLGGARVLHELASLGDDGERMTELRRRVEDEFLLFSRGRRAYYQLRYLSGAGREVVRLNVEEGLPEPVPADKLQDKSDRYYVREGLGLKPGRTYVSPMDLNVERGSVEAPPRAVVRYATPIPAANGEGRGLLVVNVHADYLFSLIGPLPPETEGFLVDEKGLYLGYVGRSEEKGMSHHLARARRLSADFTEAQQRSVRAGAGTFETEEGFVSTATVSYGPGAKWILVMSHPRSRILAPARRLTAWLSLVLAASVLLSAIAGVLVAHYVSRPIASLRRATREIAEGDLDRKVDVATGDEIEELGADFNAMTGKLREAQQRLARWTEDLEREVERKTERLQKLQSGLARADKLASVGQMTASVMHEIGNPLAAIKTRIQVEEEEGGVPPGCRALLSDVVSEIDRLATFLRSFSRLARLSEARVEKVSFGDVVRGVETLVEPEIRKRGLRLRTEVGEALPAVSGDANQLRQLLINLVLNAVQASAGPGEVVVRARETRSGILIEVVDRGEGMSRERLQQIWEPFFTTKKDGTGLGLAICRQIVNDHGGAIELRSEEGKGTVARMELPFEKEN